MKQVFSRLTGNLNAMFGSADVMSPREYTHKHVLNEDNIWMGKNAHRISQKSKTLDTML